MNRSSRRTGVFREDRFPGCCLRWADFKLPWPRQLSTFELIDLIFEMGLDELHLDDRVPEHFDSSYVKEVIFWHLLHFALECFRYRLFGVGRGILFIALGLAPQLCPDLPGAGCSGDHECRGPGGISAFYGALCRTDGAAFEFERSRRRLRGFP